MKPETSIFDEVDEAFEARHLAKGHADIEAGRVVPHEEVAAWLETGGAPDEKPALGSWFK